jgi:autotransporter-associated beta strand protein
MSITPTNYTDSTLALNTLYAYQLEAMNAAGVTVGSVIVTTPPAAPASLTAYAGDNQISLAWAAAAGATNYVLLRGTSSGGETTTVASTTATSFLDANVVNGTTYYYVVLAYGGSGASPKSPEASATPFVGPPAVYWTNTLTSAAQGWNVNANWNNGTAFPNAVQAAAIVNAPIAAPQTIDLNQDITVGALNLGTAGGAFTLTANGGTLTFDNTPGQAALMELAGASGDLINAPMTVNGGLAISNLSTATLNLAGNIAGAADGLTINGNVSLSGANTYTGGTLLTGGNLTFAAASAIPAAGSLTLENTGTVTVATANALPNVQVYGTNSVTGNGNSGSAISTLTDLGFLTLLVSGGSDVFDLTGPMTGSGTLVLGSSSMTLRINGTAGDGSAIFNLGTGAATVSVRATGTTAVALGGLTGGAGTQLQGDNSGGPGVTYTIGGAGVDTEFDGVIKDGIDNGTVSPVSVDKTGGGVLTLTAANAYSGATTLSGGTLLVENTTGSGTGTGAVIVADGGRLASTGSISGTVSVNAGGALAPGNPLGTLTINNSLTLAAGSTSYFQVAHAPATNNAVTISGTLTEGGNLVVTNSGGMALAGGDSFKLFKAGNYSGAFASLTLPALTAGLAWNTNALPTNGTLTIVTTRHPVITTAVLAKNSLVLHGNTGVAGGNYYLLGATTLLTPITNWTRLLTNQFDGSGNFLFTNLLPSNGPQSFYQLQVP